MNNIERLFRRSKGAREFASAYLDYVSRLARGLDTSAVAAFIAEIERARREGRSVFIIGNGGSAATASHMANDFGIGASPAGRGRPYRVQSLTDNVPVMTAIANDSGYDQMFLKQLRVLARPGDVLVAISASGNSPNLVRAAKWFKARVGPVIGVLGFDGGRLKPLCRLAVHVRTPRGEYGPVEDIHMVLDHLVHTWLKLSAAAGKTR